MPWPTWGPAGRSGSRPSSRAGARPHEKVIAVPSSRGIGRGVGGVELRRLGGGRIGRESHQTTDTLTTSTPSECELLEDRNLVRGRGVDDLVVVLEHRRLGVVGQRLSRDTRQRAQPPQPPSGTFANGSSRPPTLTRGQGCGGASRPRSARARRAGDGALRRCRPRGRVRPATRKASRSGQESCRRPREHTARIPVARRPPLAIVCAIVSMVKTNVTELPDSRVRVNAEVAPEEVERSLERAARELGRQMRIPGFRKGKVPAPVVIRRLGREAVLDEALRSSLGAWYSDAIGGAGIAPVGDPELDLGELPSEGEALVVLDRGRRAPAGHARRVQGPRGRRGASPSSRTPRSTARSSAFANSWPGSRRSSARRRRATTWSSTTPAPMRRRGAVPRRCGARPAARARLGKADPRLRGAARGRRGGRGTDRRGDLPEDYPEEHSPAAPRASTSRCTRSRPSACPSSTTISPPRPAGSTAWPSSGRTSASRLKKIEEQAIEREFEEAVLDAAVDQAKIEVPDKLVHARAHELL